MSGRRIRVLVVEDSRTVRERICDVLAADPELEVVEGVADGARAIERCRELRPDVVTMDMVLPGTTGLAATEHVMAYFPTPILVVSSSTNRRDLFDTYDALAAGAVDVLEKPRGDEPDDDWERRLVAAVKLVSRVRVVTHLRGRYAGNAAARTPPAASATKRLDGERRRFELVAIGASTGGPGAVARILRELPPSFLLPIVVVVHIGEPFAAAFAEWLGGASGRSVSYAVDGEPLCAAAGRVVMAPPGRHLLVEGERFRLDHGPERHACRPSIDTLFESLAAFGPRIAACLLTGMGRDGAAGLLEIRRRGGLTIAQDEATSIVFGMPREAALLGAVERVLPLDDVAAALAELPTSSGRVGA